MDRVGGVRLGMITRVVVLDSESASARIEIDKLVFEEEVVDIWSGSDDDDIADATSLS